MCTPIVFFRRPCTILISNPNFKVESFHIYNCDRSCAILRPPSYTSNQLSQQLVIFVDSVSALQKVFPADQSTVNPVLCSTRYERTRSLCCGRYQIVLQLVLRHSTIPGHHFADVVAESTLYS